MTAQGQMRQDFETGVSRGEPIETEGGRCEC